LSVSSIWYLPNSHMAWGFPSFGIWRCIIPDVSKARRSLETSGMTQRHIAEWRNPQLLRCNIVKTCTLTRFILILSTHSL